MQRYIDARYIINRITEERRKWGDDYDVEQVLGEIEDAPTIEVVRCKDCKYYNPIGVCIEMSSAVCEDSFCCWAERRTDDN